MTPSDTAQRRPQPWTEVQIVNLRRIYEAHPAPFPLPSAAELERVLGHPMRSITHKAQKLGLTAGKRTSTARTLLDRDCASCGTTFRPGYDAQLCCSPSCGQKLNIAINGHARGMAGKRHADATRARLSETSKAAWARATPAERDAMLGPMRAAPVPARTENTFSRTRSGKRADLDGLFVRSSWEANYARYLNWLQSLGQVAGWTYEPRTFEFPVKRGNRSYTPDFLVTKPDGSTEWHEVKGWMNADSRVKLKRFARYYPDEVLVLIDERTYRALARKVAPLIEGWEA